MSDSALSISELSYSYASNWSWKKACALSPFSLTVPPGESFGFLGHNGAGKTTTIKCILDIVRPTKGNITLFGVPSTHKEARALVGYISEYPYFYDNLTVTETLSLYAKLLQIPAPRRTARIDTCIERAGLSSRRNSLLRSLSKGLLQRVALAQALLGEPKLLILDEPFSGLDPLGRKEFRDIFSELKQQGTTLFISSHILSDVEFLCDRISIMVKGVLQGIYSIRDLPSFSDTTYEIVARPPLDFTLADSLRTVSEGRHIRFEFSSKEAAEQALKKILEQRIDLISFTSRKGNLEDLFVQVVHNATVNNS